MKWSKNKILLKKPLAMLLCLLTVTMCVQTSVKVMAADVQTTASGVTVTLSDENLQIQTSSSNKQYSTNGGVTWTTYTGSITVSGTGNVKVLSGTHDVTLDNAELTGDNTYGSAFDIASDAAVNMTLIGRNTCTTSISGYAGVQVPDGAALTITEASTGSLKATGGYYAAGIGGGQGGTGGTITIAGGTVTAAGGTRGAGIGGGEGGDGGTITISGGFVDTDNDGYRNGGAAIGGGYNGAGKIVTITGGEVIAKGGHGGAGIGGGEGGPGGIITITGGTVTAEGEDGSISCGAGIGGGDGGYGGTITISGGTVTALGGIMGAAIGGGYWASSGTITIRGGDVTAEGYGSGAGIGGGVEGDGDEITITGGTVTATAQSDGAGIGGGGDGGCGGTITITGGTVTATGGHNTGTGIGGDGAGAGGIITISGGTVTAISNNATSSAIGDGADYADTDGTSFSVNGNAFITAIGGESSSGDIAAPLNKDDWSGVILEGKTAMGYVYGNNITLTTSAEVPLGYTLYVENYDTHAGNSLTVGNGCTLTNSGTIKVAGSLGGSVDGNAVYYKLTVKDGAEDVTSSTALTSATGGIDSIDGNMYVQTGDTVTLPAPGGTDLVGQKASWKNDGGVTITENQFTMPSKVLTVTVHYINTPTYTVTIPETVQLGETVTVSADGVNVAEGSSLDVSISSDSVFEVSNGDVKLGYKVNKVNGDTITAEVTPGDSVFTVAGGVENNSGSVELTFAVPALADIKFSGTYTGTVTFAISVKEVSE